MSRFLHLATHVLPIALDVLADVAVNCWRTYVSPEGTLMAESVTLHLSDDMLERYRHGAAVAGKHLDEFLVDRLAELSLPIADDLPDSSGDDLKALEELDDQRLWQAARSVISDEKQDEYNRLLDKQAKEVLTADEQKRLKELGDNARRLTVKKSHAFMLLKWRGHSIPSRDDLHANG